MSYTMDGPSVMIVDFPSSPRSTNTHNSVLDDEQHYCKVDLLQHVDDGHILKQLSRQLSAATHIPESTIFLMGLGIFSSMTCRKWVVLYPDGQKLVLGLYVVAEQPSGTGKSRCLKMFQEPFIDAYITAKQNVLKDIALLDGRNDLTEAEAEKLEGLKQKQKSLCGPLFVTNATPEGLETALNLSGGYFAAASSEQGLLTSLLGLLYGQTANNNDVVLNGFDGGFVSSLRISRTAFSGFVVGGLACFAQSGAIETVLENSKGTGYAERILLLAEPHFLGGRDHKQRVVIDPGLLHQYKIATDFAIEVFQNQRNFKDLSLLTLSNAGHDEIAEFRNEIEPHLADGGKYSHISIRGAASKIDMQVMKIAANLHLFSVHRYKSQIEDGFVLSAVEIAKELLEANLALCTDKGFVGQKAEYSSILELFEKDQRPRHERQIINAKRQSKPFSEMSGNRSDAVRKALAEMVEAGLLRRTIDAGKINYQLWQ